MWKTKQLVVTESSAKAKYRAVEYFVWIALVKAIDG